MIGPMKGRCINEKEYWVVVIGIIPADMILRVSKIHAKACLKAQNQNAIGEESPTGMTSTDNQEKGDS